MARMLFVAELAEILMEFSGSAWNPGNSMGEGLSLLAAETLHPIGYYATGQGPRINTWLNGSRPDSISSSVETDKDAVSYGCAVLFLNYLRYQRQFSFESIIAAAGAAGILRLEISLAGVFSVLTGEPGSLAYKEFTDLLQAHIPLGQPFTPTRDNLFPLGDSNRRTVSFSPFENELNAVKQDESLFIELKVGPLCSPNVYTYNNVNVFSQLDLSGRVLGFLQPTFTWALNGIVLNNSNVTQPLTVSMIATDTVPGTREKPLRVDVDVKYLIKSSGLTSTLSIWNQTFPGNGDLTISLSAAESFVAGDVATNFTDSQMILTRRYLMGGAWGRDVATCNIKDFGLVTQTVKSLARRLVEDENRPNPNPAVIRALAAATRSYVGTLDRLTGGSRGLDRTVIETFKELEAVGAPLEPLTLNDSKTGLRIRRNVVEVPKQVLPETNQQTDELDQAAVRSPVTI